MSSTVSQNAKIAGNLSPAQWLERQFETRLAAEDFGTWHELIDIMEDHPGTECSGCQENRSTTADGFWWRHPGDDPQGWYQDILSWSSDEVLVSLLINEENFPEPATVFGVGPEYPTGD